MTFAYEKLFKSNDKYTFVIIRKFAAAVIAKQNAMISNSMPIIMPLALPSNWVIATKNPQKPVPGTPIAWKIENIVWKK